MFGRVEMYQTSRSDLQRHEHIKHAKGGGHGGEEVGELSAELRKLLGGVAIIGSWPANV
jgi:hypothetical protein